MADCIEQRLQRIAVTHVGRNKRRAVATMRGHLQWCMPGTDDHLGTGGEKFAGDPRTDTLGAASDEHHLAAEIKPRVLCHVVFLVLLTRPTLGTTFAAYFV
ncbi:hypothetical protein D3C78_1396980 [compost metagenome]